MSADAPASTMTAPVEIPRNKSMIPTPLLSGMAACLSNQTSAMNAGKNKTAGTVLLLYVRNAQLTASDRNTYTQV
jgi:hypothetical protein